MFKQSPSSRSQRSKGFKVKNALQIGLLLAVCIWLIYQVKHSHDKKKEFDESVAKLSERMEREHNIIKFGRKDLHPRVEEGASGNERHVEEEDVPEEEDEEDIKHEEEVQPEEENKAEESEVEIREGGDEENDERDQERIEVTKRDGDSVDEEERDRHDNDIEETEEKDNEEKENEETEEKDNEEKENEETEEKDNEEKDNEETEEKDHEEKDNGEMEEKYNEERNNEVTEDKDNEEKEVEGKEREETEGKENELENKEKEDQIEEQYRDRNTQDAREEHYKQDDASSAVVRDAQSLGTESDTRALGKSNEEVPAENLGAVELGMENKTNSVEEATSDRNSSNVPTGEGETVEGNSIVNSTGIEGMGTATNLSRIEVRSDDNRTTSIENIVLHEVTPDSTAQNAGTSNPSLQNGTDATQDETVIAVTSNGTGDSDHQQVLQEHAENSNTTAEIVRSDNSTLSTPDENEIANKGESEDSSSNHGTDLQQEHDTQGEEHTESLTTNENGEDGQNEKSRTTTESEDNTSDSTANDNVDSFETKPDESTDDPLISQVNEAGIDLTTLPEIETGGTNSEDASAE